MLKLIKKGIANINRNYKLLNVSSSMRDDNNVEDYINDSIKVVKKLKPEFKAFHQGQFGNFSNDYFVSISNMLIYEID